MGEWRYSSIILDLGTKWKWVASFTLRSIYFRGIRSRYELYRRLGWVLSRYGRYGEKKKVAPPEIEPQPSSHYIDPWILVKII
jgi:hypothetical protein